MIQRVLFVLTLSLAVSASFGQDKEAQTLTVATYNLYNMFDVYDDPYSRDEGTRVKPRAEIEKVAEAIRAINADVIAVQEVENEGILRTMVQKMLGDMKYRHVVVMPTNSERGGNIGVISRKPVVSIKSHRWARLTLEGKESSWRFARDLMQVTIQATESKTLDLFVVHLKSKRTVAGDPNAVMWRSAEALGARRIVDRYLQANPGAWVCLAGDCNDTPDSAPIQLLLKPDAKGKAPLADLHSSLAKEKRITYRSKSYGNSNLDYIMASKALADRVVPDSAIIYSDADKASGSDHLPVVVKFNLAEPK